jgi:hypothetical protein
MICLLRGHLASEQFCTLNMLKDIHIQNYRGIKDLKIKDFNSN